MNKKSKLLILFATLILLLVVGIIVVSKTNLFRKKATKLEPTEGITVVPTMNDKITTDSNWCGTFQLVWNDMKNELVKQAVVFNPQLEMEKKLKQRRF